MKKNYRRIAITILVLGVLVGVLVYWFVTRPPRGEQTNAVDNRLATVSPQTDGLLHPSDNTQIEIPAEEAGVEGISIPILWIGDPVESVKGIELLNLEGGGAVAKAATTRERIRCAKPARGRYRFDFQGASIYCPDHEIRVTQEKTTMFLAIDPGARALPLTAAIVVNIITKSNGSAGDSVELRWQPAQWPSQWKPDHRIKLALESPVEQLVPVQGLTYEVLSDEYVMNQPAPGFFKAAKAGDTLVITLGHLIPLIVDVLEDEPGRWRDLLLASRATDGENGRVVKLQVNSRAATSQGDAHFAMHGAFPRKLDESIQAGASADSFTLNVPRISTESVVSVVLSLHGGTVVASGEAVVAANPVEVRMVAHLVAYGTATVVVQDEQGRPLSDISLALDAYYEQGGSSLSVGQVQRRVTDSDGRAMFDQLPLGERLFAQVSADTTFPVISDVAHIALKRDGVPEILVTLDTGHSRVLRIEVNGRESTSSQKACAITVVEGDGRGAWHRLTSVGISPTASSAVVGIKSEHVLIVGRCADCIFSQSAWLTEHETTIAFDLGASFVFTGLVLDWITVSDETGAVHPYDLPSSLAWGSALGSDGLPSIVLDSQAKFRVRVLKGASPSKWRITTKRGEVLGLTPLTNVVDGTEVVELTVDPVETARVTIRINAEGLKDATQVAVLVTPAFYEDARSVEAELRFSYKLNADKDGKLPVLSLPLGRYVAILTYTDKDGVTRFGLSPGSYGVFEAKAGLLTDVFLPFG